MDSLDSLDSLKSLESLELLESLESLDLLESLKLLDLLEIRKTSLTDSLTDNFKSRDASASKNAENRLHKIVIIFFLLISNSA